MTTQPMTPTTETPESRPVIDDLLASLSRIADMRDRDGHMIDMHREELRGIARTAITQARALLARAGGTK